MIFKTHLDIGFTDLSSKVEQRYIDYYIPKAIEVARRLREEGGDERYVWTTGAWLVDAYLRQATPEAAAELEEAIRRGDIVWNGVPYTVESESMNRALFEGILRLSQRLDARFGKHTSAAKMTDVPGHTRSIVPLLSEAGIGFLHVGTNPAVSVPDVPSVCRWRDPASGREIILMYQGSYGDTMLLPDGRTAVSINLTGDNHGPHSIEEVHRIFASLRERYPSARIVAASLNDVAAALEPMRADLPVITSEIGDTWIYGYGSAPLRMARFRELGRLYDGWIRQGRLAPDSDAAIDFAVRLGMIAEHTWGADVKTHLRNWDKYDFDSFTAARTQPEFLFTEQSWRELDDNIDKAVALLPDPLREEAREALKHVGEVDRHPVTGNDSDRKLDAAGRYAFETKGVKCLLGGIAYQSFSNDDYTRFQDAYLTSHVQWAIEDNGKPGLDRSPARSATIEARVAKCSVERSREGRRIRTEMVFPEDARIDPRVLPEAVRCQWEIARDGRSVAWTVDLVGKPANRTARGLLGFDSARRVALGSGRKDGRTRRSARCRAGRQPADARNRPLCRPCHAPRHAAHHLARRAARGCGRAQRAELFDPTARPAAGHTLLPLRQPLGHELLHVVGRRHALPVPGGVDRRGGMFRETVKISAK